MILKAFKEKSNQKYINNLLNSRKAVFTTNKVKTIGVLLNLEDSFLLSFLIKTPETSMGENLLLFFFLKAP